MPCLAMPMSAQARSPVITHIAGHCRHLSARHFRRSSLVCAVHPIRRLEIDLGVSMDGDERGGRQHKKARGGSGSRHKSAAAQPAAGPAPPLDLPVPAGGTEIDGSMLEGGGQILRNASALSVILGKPLKVDKIRAGRDKPGLRPQHLTGLQLIAELCSGQLQGGAVGSSCITLAPGELFCGTHVADTRTAGSCTLLAQSALPCLLFARPAGGAQAASAAAAGAAAAQPRPDGGHAAEAAAAPAPAAAQEPAALQAGAKPSASTAAPAEAAQPTAPPMMGPVASAAALEAAVLSGTASRLDLRGGTDAAMAPPAGYLEHVLLPVLRSRLGISAEVQLQRRGFFPKGQGHVVLTVQALPPGARLPAIDLTERSDIECINVRAFTAGRLVPSVGDRLVAAALKEIKARMPRCSVSRQVALTVKVVHEPPERAFGDGCGVLVTARSTTGCVFGATGLGERGVPAEAIGERAAGELMDCLASGACTDEWLQDQLLIFMALAEGRSRLLTGEPTLHTRTACMVAEALTGARFSITQQPRPPGFTAESGLWLVECHGAAVPAPSG